MNIQQGIEIPPYSDIQEAVDTPFEDDKCKLGVDNVQDVIDALCSGPLLIAECWDLGGCGFSFKNIDILYSKDGCALLLRECNDGDM